MFTDCSSAVAVPPGCSGTVAIDAPGDSFAGSPSCVPSPCPTTETPGYPRSEQAAVPVLVKTMREKMLPAAESSFRTVTARAESGHWSAGASGSEDAVPDGDGLGAGDAL